MRIASIRVAMMALAAFAVVPVVRAQEAPTARPAPAPIRLRLLGPDVYWATDRSNVGVIVGRTGVIVFDAMNSPERARELLGEIAKVTTKPVTTVILSHVDEDHVNGLAAFPVGVRIIAQANTARQMRGRVPADRMPTEVVTGDRTLVLDGVRLRLLHRGPAHTSGDLVVYLPDRKVVFAGDIFCMDQPRAFIKPELDGSSAGWIRTARAILVLDADQVVVGHGGVDGKANLRRFVDLTAAERDGIVRGVAQGRTLPEIEQAVGEPQPSSVPLPPGAHQARFAEVVYGELTRRK